MKLQLEINIDWIDEDSNIDEAIKQQVIDAIVNKIQGKIESKATEQSEALINQTITSKIDQLTQKTFDEFMNKEIIISDRYGDVLKSYTNVFELMKERFDNFMTQTVDEKGVAYDGNYSKKHQRLTFIVDKQLREFADKFTQDAVKKVSEEIQAHVKQGLTQKLGAELMKVLKVEKMLELEEKN